MNLPVCPVENVPLVPQTFFLRMWKYAYLRPGRPGCPGTRQTVPGTLPRPHRPPNSCMWFKFIGFFCFPYLYPHSCLNFLRPPSLACYFVWAQRAHAAHRVFFANSLSLQNRALFKSENQPKEEVWGQISRGHPSVVHADVPSIMCKWMPPFWRTDCQRSPKNLSSAPAASLCSASIERA